MIPPAHDGYFADPFVLKLADGAYVAYGSSGATVDGARAFEALVSDDLTQWRSIGPVLERPDASLGNEYWAPEVAAANGAFWLYYSVGHSIQGHHIRVARAETAHGPFIDQGVNLTPGETFAIDAHPFLDADGQWYLYFACDVLDADRPGTHLAVAPLATMTSTAAPAVSILEPNADWQIYKRQRLMYGELRDWHTLEGPSVVIRDDRYWLTYSGGAWTGPDYAVSWAVAESPLGPWQHAPLDSPPLLSTSADLIGPGHNSLTVDARGDDVIAFHAWDEAHTARQLHVHRISFEPEGPRVDGPIRGPSTLRQLDGLRTP